MRFPAIVLMIVFCATAQFPDTFLGSVSVGQNPSDICLSPDGSRAYAAVRYGFVRVISIDGYDEFSQAGIVSTGGEPVTLQCDPAGEYLYVADQENNLVHIVNTSTLTVESTLSVQPFPTDMVLYSEGKRIYLSHENGMLTVINTETREIEDSFWVGQEVNSLCITPSQSLIFAADNGGPEEGLITTSTGILSHFNSGMDSYGCAVSGDGARLFLSCVSWNTIGVIDISSMIIEETIICSSEAPAGMIALPELPYLYGVCPDLNEVTVYNTDNLTREGGIPVTGEPSYIAVHPDGERLFVVCTSENKVKVIGFDPSGVSNINDWQGETQTLFVTNSPSSAPSIEYTSANTGSVRLRAYDLSGRKVWAAQAAVMQNEMQQFTLSSFLPGILIITAENEGSTVSARVVVLEP